MSNISIASIVDTYITKWYLEQPTVKLTQQQLKKAFPDTNPDNLKTIHARWRKKQRESPKQSKRAKKTEIEDIPEFDDLEYEVDDSFKKLIQYSKYASRNRVDIGTNTILQHLDKTDQLIQSEEEIIDFTELVDSLEKVWERLTNANEGNFILD
jgi:hypothetical protein